MTTAKTTYPELTPAQLVALRITAKRKGAFWKARILQGWEAGILIGELQALRNSHGPKWLAKFKLPPEQTAAEAYDAKKVQIEASLMQLEAALDANLAFGDATINWGHVGTAGRIEELLRQAIAMLPGAEQGSR